jgi:hypothetical protein
MRSQNVQHPGDLQLRVRVWIDPQLDRIEALAEFDQSETLVSRLLEALVG